MENGNMACRMQMRERDGGFTLTDWGCLLQLSVNQHANMNATKLCLTAVLQKACYHKVLKSSKSSFKQDCTNANYTIKKENKTEYPL